MATGAEAGAGGDQNDTNDTSWHQYVRAPPSRTVLPKAVLSEHTSGHVVNPNGLIDGKATTQLVRYKNATETPTVVLDFGRDVVGLLTIDFAGSTSFAAGKKTGLRLIFSETLEYLTNRSDFTRSDNASGKLKIVYNGTDQIAVGSQPYTWQDQWGCEYGDQVCSDGLHGFRYVKLELDALPIDSSHTSPYGSVSISSVSLQWSGFLGTPATFTGWFECSDSDLTQWWFDGAYTTEMCTDIFRANDTEPRDATSPSLLGKLVLHDGAKRDRDPYQGDLAVSALTSYLTHDVQEAARNVMEDLAQHQRGDGWISPASINNYTLPLFDYPLWWVSCSWDYVFYTGNQSYIESSYYSTMLSVLDKYYPANTDNTTSLLLRPDGYGDYAFIPRDGSAAYYSALYVLALNRAADLADLLSKSSDAARWRTRANKVSQAFVNVLWDPSVNVFFDRRCSGSGCTAHAQDGNSLAILSGIVSANSSKASSLLQYLATNMRQEYGNAFYDAGGDALGTDMSTRVYAFTSYFEIAARFEAGEVTSALDQIRRMYGWMATHDPYSTHWEGIGPGGTPYEQGDTSMAHGWSTGIVPLLTNYVLGVQPVKPGFEEWSVRPVTGDLSWARGQVPTPHGSLGVSWTVEDGGGSLQIEIDVPGGTSGTVSVPADGVRTVDVDGVVVWDGESVKGENVDVKAEVEGGYLDIGVKGGAVHVIRAAKSSGS